MGEQPDEGTVGMDLRDYSIASLAEGVRRRELSARELIEVSLARIETANPTINAWASLDATGARAQADDIDRRLAGGEDVGPLAGIPLGVKDLEDAAGFVTGYGSAYCASDSPANRDSIEVARLRAAGCVVIGKTTTSEFGYAGDTVTPHWGATVNPWDTTRSSGGSSGGSSAALASGMVALTTGSDGGGSIRIPAALCGLTGLKTTHGVVPLGQGVPPAGGTLTVRGPMARTAADTALALAVAAGPDPSDPFSLGALAFGEPLRPRLPDRIVWAPAPGFPVDDSIAAVCGAMVHRLESEGVEIIEVEGLFRAEPIADWFGLWAIYRERGHGHLRGTPEWDLFEDGLRALMDHGADQVDVRTAMAALDAIHRYAADLASHLANAPFVVTPTVAGQTARSGGLGTVNGEETIFWAPFTQAANLTRHPAGSVCVGRTDDGLPVGLQVMADHRRDVEVLEVMAAIEELAGPVEWP